MNNPPLNEHVTTNQAVLDAEALLASFTSKLRSFGQQYAESDRNVLGALVLFADQAVLLAAQYADTTPRDIRLKLRQMIAQAVASNPKAEMKGGSK